MQVVCGNCQLSFQAPDGATGLVCPICRSPLRAPDAAGETQATNAQQPLDWSGGTLDELVSLLSGPAWSARVEVLPANGGSALGEVHVIAGGVSDAIYDGKSTHDALDKLRAAKAVRFRVDPRLPNPSDGDLTFPGPEQGKLEERPLAHLMRYCEDYVLTAAIEVWRGSENAKVDYRRGEIVAVTVGGIDAPERLGEVMKWSSGSYRLLVPKLTLPDTAPKAAAPAPAAVVAPRAAGAASKTIFGMPALDPAAIAAATDRVKAVQAQLQAKAAASGATPAATPGPAPAPTLPGGSSPANGPTPVRAATAPAGASASTPAPAPAPAAAATPAAPHQSGAMAKTIFGVPPAVITPPPAAAPAAPAPAAAKPSTAPASAEPSKPARSTGPHAPAARTQATAPAVSAASAELDRTAPSKAAKEKSGETPVLTYVGVGFVFGLALLGVYRLVIVLAH